MSGMSQLSKWVLDSEVSHHMTSDLCAFGNLHSLYKSINIVLLDGRVIVAKEAGKVSLGGLMLKEVLHAPTFTCNMLSV